jgi:hypothetical protein
LKFKICPGIHRGKQFKALRERVPLRDARSSSRSNNVRREERREEYREEPRPPEPRPEPKQDDQRERRRFRKLDPEKMERFRGMLEELTGTRAAYLLDESWEVIGKVPVKEMFNALKEVRANALVFDGEIDQKLIEFCAQRGVKFVVGMKSKQKLRPPSAMQVYSLREFS